MKYIVYFEIFGKKMKTEIIAKNPAEAKQKVLSKIIFHKIEEDNELTNLFNMFGIKL